MTKQSDDPKAPSAAPEYDVAISFLAKDDQIAGALADRLGESLKVFCHPRAQEQLAGTDGIETMRKPFFDGSRVAVILYREPWGETPWTRVEATAIKDGCLARGWANLMFVQLDETSKLPIWLPNTHIRFPISCSRRKRVAAARRDLCGLEFEKSRPSPIIHDTLIADERRTRVAAPVLLGVLFTWRRSSVE
jgi:hypothetical protein